MLRRSGFAVLMLVLAVVSACSQDAFGPDRYARKHVIVTNVVACPAGQFNLEVSWVNWQWQAIFLKGAQQVANVTNDQLTKSSGCIYALNDKARVKLVPLGDIAQYLDSDFVDVTIQPTQ